MNVCITEREGKRLGSNLFPSQGPGIGGGGETERGEVGRRWREGKGENENINEWFIINIGY